MDCQVKEVELRVKQKARQEIEAERKSLRDIYKDEMSELQAHLSMFEKVNLVISYQFLKLQVFLRSTHGSKKITPIKMMIS